MGGLVHSSAKNVSEWSDMLANALAEQYYACDVEINGTRFFKVGIRPKKNTSLGAIVSDRIVNCTV